MDGNQSDTGSDLLGDLLRHASAFGWGPLWQFMSPDELVRGPILNPEEALPALQARYSIHELQQANLVDFSPGVGLRLRPDLCNPVGAIVGMRNEPTERISCLMTPRGSLPNRLDPLALAQLDHTTRKGIDQSDVVFCTFSIRDAVVLRALGFPAVVGLGLCNLDLSTLEKYQESDGAELYSAAMAKMAADLASNSDGKNRLQPDGDASVTSPPDGSPPPSTQPEAHPLDLSRLPPMGGASSPPPAPMTSAPSAPPLDASSPPPLDGAPSPPEPAPADFAVQGKPTLVLVGWSPWSLTFPYAKHLTRVANFFAGLHRDMDMEFDIAAWQIAPSDIGKLRTRLKWRHIKKITELLWESADGLHNLEEYATANATKAEQSGAAQDLLSARAHLISALKGDLPWGGGPERVRQAENAYRDCLQRELTFPLVESAVSDPDPLQRNVGMQLATICGLLNAMAPRVEALLEEQARSPELAALRQPQDHTVEDYLKLNNQASALIRDLIQLRRS